MTIKTKRQIIYFEFIFQSIIVGYLTYYFAEISQNTLSYIFNIIPMLILLTRLYSLIKNEKDLVVVNQNVYVIEEIEINFLMFFTGVHYVCKWNNNIYIASEKELKFEKNEY